MLLAIGALGAGIAPALAALVPARGATEPSVAAYVAAAGGVVTATTHFTLDSHSSAAIPAFARKYDLSCSACHTAWPELNAFGQRFKDRGYQLGNDRDSPIWVNPSYIPLAFRTTPGYRMDRATNQVTLNDPAGGTTLTQSGFDIGGADFLMLGTLYKDVTFGFVPTFEDGEGVGIETAFLRLDNLFKSSWANLKVGKFELDNLLSEKRIATLSSGGGFYQGYHFLPVGSGNNFGLGDNQIGAEWMGHDATSYRRFSVAVLNQEDGVPGLGTSKGMDYSITASQAFDAGNLGLMRLGVFGYFGSRPTAFEFASDTSVVPGSGSDAKSFSRIGFTGNLSIHNLELLPVYLHGSEDKALGAGAQNASWNSYLLEAHYFVNPQLMLMGRGDFVRMSQQGDPSIPKTQGNADVITLGVRYYPIMFSRAGLAWHTELSFGKTTGVSPMSEIGNEVDPPPLPGTVIKTTSLLTAFDFDF
ncbi:MAG TPA: hypothetical protein VFI13_03570 [Gemmatimonadales bacterium]|nr:hypothetical protein [Gemmatimonadales bacterium]